MKNPWAMQALQSDALLLDTETTGLGGSDQVIEIAVIDMAGRALIDQRLRPSCPVSPGAALVHGITAADLVEAPTWPEMHEGFRDVLSGRAVLVYNAAFDRRLLMQTARVWGCGADWVKALRTDCVMLAYSRFRLGGRWSKLTGGDHSALGDCRATLDLIKRMAGQDGQADA